LYTLDFLRLRSNTGKLNDNLVDAALETLCTRHQRVGTCTTLLWDAAVARRLQTLRPYTDGFVLARCRQRHWTGVFIDLIASGVLIYNSLPSLATDTLAVVAQVLRVLG
jgi:hypothetical protein